MPTFKKPGNVKYTDMCIYIDKHVYTEDADDEKIFEYLYHVINMLAHQGGYFKNAQYYDEFAMSGATRVFLRLRNPKQFLKESGDDTQTQLKPIKNVLDYIKSIMYPMKVQFEQENYQQNSAYDRGKKEVVYEIQNDFRQSLEESIDALSLVEFNLYLADVAKTARAFMEQIPTAKYSAEWMNIYTSVLLSFLNSITFNNANKQKIMTMKEILKQNPEVLDRLYKKERKDCIILYHLDEKYRAYVTVLYNRLRHLLAKDLSASLKKYIPSEINAKNLLMSSLEEENGSYED